MRTVYLSLPLSLSLCAGVTCTVVTGAASPCVAIAQSSGTAGDTKADTSGIPSGVDPNTDSLLTAQQLTNYVAVRRAIGDYWKVPAHASMKHLADSTAYNTTLMLGSMPLTIPTKHYASLIQRDTALAAIFTKHHLSPEQFQNVEISAARALAMLFMARSGVALPSNTTVLGKNIALVKAHQQELASAGAVIGQDGGDGGMGGGMDGGMDGGMGGDDNSMNP